MHTYEDRCKARVFSGGSYRSYQCDRKHTKDGYCWQHHPDAEAKRRDKSDREYREKLDNSPHRIAARKVEKLESEKHQLIKAILDWAKTPGNHGGNPYTKDFVILAMELRKEEDDGS